MAPQQAKTTATEGNVPIQVEPSLGEQESRHHHCGLLSPLYPLLDITTAKRRQIWNKRKLQEQQQQQQHHNDNDGDNVIALPSRECLCQAGLMEAASAAGVPLLDVTSAKRRILLLKKERACRGEPCVNRTIALPSQECLCQIMAATAAAFLSSSSSSSRPCPLLDVTTAKRRKILIQQQVAYSGGYDSDNQNVVIIPLPWSQVCILQDAHTLKEFAAFGK